MLRRLNNRVILIAWTKYCLDGTGGECVNSTTEAFKKLIEEQFDGNYNNCARSLDLAPSTVWRIATGNSKAGIKTITNIVKYCNEKHIKYDSYVFF